MIKWLIVIIPVIAVLFIVMQNNAASCEDDVGRCYSSTVSRIIDGDTIKDADDTSIRFALTSTPELDELGGQDAKLHLEKMCPVGSPILIDEDDGQLQGSYGRVIAMVYCNGHNLNQLMVSDGYATVDSRFCSDSEFSTHSWTNCN